MTPNAPRLPRLAASTVACLIAACTAALALGCATTDGGGGETMSPKEQSDFHYKLANGYFYERQIPPALAELTTALEIDPENPDAHHLMGFIFFGRKDFVSAETHFRKALQIRPGFHQARANLGALLLEQKRWQDAIDTLEPLIGATLYQTPWVPYNNIGIALENLGRRREALESYRMAVFHNPLFCLGLNNLGRMQHVVGQSDQAVDTLRRATEKCKGYAEPHFTLGELFESRGEHGEARREFEACWKAAPDSPLGGRCRRRL